MEDLKEELKNENNNNQEKDEFDFDSDDVEKECRTDNLLNEEDKEICFDLKLL